LSVLPFLSDQSLYNHVPYACQEEYGEDAQYHVTQEIFRSYHLRCRCHIPAPKLLNTPPIQSQDRARSQVAAAIAASRCLIMITHQVSGTSQGSSARSFAPGRISTVAAILKKRHMPV